MMKIGLTGGIGSGKTTVAKVFSILDIPVFSSDLEGRRLMNEDQALRESITEKFGASVYEPDPEGKSVLNRKKLAGIVFSDEARLRELNALVHPAVIRAFDDWARKQESAYVIKESALLFESGAYRHTDWNIVVTAPKEERIARVMKRDGVDREQVLARMKHQLSEEDKVKKADFVVSNDNKQLVIPQVLAIHRLLLYSPSDLVL